MPTILWPMALLIAGADQSTPTPAPPPSPEDLAGALIALGEAAERMTVPVEIAGAGPYRFIIDTGSQRTVISRQLAGNLRLPAGRPVNVTAMSGTTRVGTVIIPSIRISTVPDVGAIHAPALDALDLGALGLLGIDTLRDHVVTIDLAARTMAVAPALKRAKAQRAGPDEIVVRAKSLFGQLIVTDAEFEDHPIRVVIDTGSPVSVGNRALRRLVSRQSGPPRPLELTSATGGKVNTDYALVDKIRVGNIQFRDLPIAFADVAPFERFGLEKRPAMLLGMSSLRNFRQVRIDFANREVRFLLPRRDRMVSPCAVTVGGNCAI